MTNEDIKSTQRVSILGSFEYKLDEMEFFIEEIRSEYIENQRKIDQKGQTSMVHMTRIDYFFNAYANCFQSLKDMMKFIIENEGSNRLGWKAFESVEYGLFMQNIRNSITHDGKRCINLYSSGKFYLSNAGGKIRRLGSRMEIIEFDCPREDVLAICVGFYLSFLSKIKEIILRNESSFYLDLKVLSNIGRDETRDNVIIPQFVKDAHAKFNLDDFIDSDKPAKSLLQNIDERISRYEH